MKGLPSYDASQLQPQAKRLPGEEGIWVFIIGDLVVFSIFFIVFLSYRADGVAQFSEAQRTLNQGLGLLNTILLLTSSLFVALAVQSTRAGAAAAKRAPILLLAGLTCSLGFIFVKFLEWTEKISAGHTLGSGDFFMFYFMYTGVHLLHVIVGTGVLLGIYFLSRRREPSESDLRMIEAGGIFWHLVDMLWVFLFALFYLLR